MSLRTEPGTIIAAIKTGGPYYQVMLDSGSVVIVSQEQVQPPRATLLAKGARLLIAHDLGVVQWVSSDLQRGLPVQVVKLRGRVTAVIAGAQEVTYRVQLQSGLPRLVPAHLVTPQVGRELLVGAILELTVVDEALTAARLLSEKLAVTIQAIDVERRIVNVAGGQRERLKVRLPSGEDIGQLKVGGRLEMEYTYDGEGQRRVALSPPQPTRPLKGPEIVPPRQEPASPVKPEGSAGRQVAEKKHALPLAAEYYGLDPSYLAARQREGHRFEIMAFLNEHKQDGLVEWYRMRAEKNARFASPIQPLAAGLQTALRSADPAFVEMYNHQARALDCLRAGHSLVIVTPTASGKTLCYNPAIFERFAKGEDAHALYIFPLNALMTDQKQKIDELRQGLAQQGLQVEAEVLRGGLGKDRRIAIAHRSPNIIAANPEMLSVMLDEASQQWASFFASLKYIILDEVHAYRGIFGMHMAGLLRRLQLTARRSGASPQYILSSATVSNPLDLAVRLTGLPEASFDLLDERSDGSQQACKHWAVLNPDWGTRYSDYHGYLTVAALTMVELLCGKDARGHPAPLNTILFARSISDVNRAYRM
ncbi:MAG: DEAD/DEAH box helicase, partial [Chloroflexi bacterium]|nr:DEAD/DEAH box helicase [Chloroflexota bacterium]